MVIAHERINSQMWENIWAYLYIYLLSKILFNLGTQRSSTVRNLWHTEYSVQRACRLCFCIFRGNLLRNIDLGSYCLTLNCIVKNSTRLHNFFSFSSLSHTLLRKEGKIQPTVAFSKT